MGHDILLDENESFDGLGVLQKANIAACEVRFISLYYLAKVPAASSLPFLGGEGMEGEKAGQPGSYSSEVLIPGAHSTFARSQSGLGGTGPSRASFLHFKVSSLAKGSGIRSWDVGIKPTGFQIGLFSLSDFDYRSPLLRFTCFYTQNTC